MKITPLREVRTAFFSDDAATPSDVAYRLTCLLNDVSNQLRTLADVMDDPAPWNINVNRSLLNGAAALLLAAEPYIAQLDTMEVQSPHTPAAVEAPVCTHHCDGCISHTPAAVEASPARFDGFVDELTA